jgi:hypothetical protein
MCTLPEHSHPERRPLATIGLFDSIVNENDKAIEDSSLLFP